MSSRPVIEVLDEAALPARAAGMIVSTLRNAIGENGTAVLVPSAGRTPTQTYRALYVLHADSLDWRRVHIVQMDEYRGLGPDDPLSFAHYLLGELVRPLHVGAFTHFNNRAGTLIRPLENYERSAGTIDLVVHGIGRNGHVGFNEPLADRLRLPIRPPRGFDAASQFCDRNRAATLPRGPHSWDALLARRAEFAAARDGHRKSRRDPPRLLFAALERLSGLAAARLPQPRGARRPGGSEPHRTEGANTPRADRDLRPLASSS